MNLAPQLRNFTTWAHHKLAEGRIDTARSHLPVDEEYWLALRHPSETSSVGLALLSQHSPGVLALPLPEREQRWREFRAYVRQAEGFYRGAAVLPWQSSPLNHYYSFMNLAKALGVIRGELWTSQPGLPRRLRHGLTASVVTGDPDEWRLVTQGEEEIFPLLYRLSTGTAISKGTVLNARQLLPYVSAIGWQLQQSGYHARSWFECYWGLVGNGDDYWDIVVVPRDLDLEGLPPRFQVTYEELAHEHAKNMARMLFDMHATQASSFRFLQRVTPFHSDTPGVWNFRIIDDDLKACLPGSVFEHLSREKHLSIALPYPANPSPIAMNEQVAAYAVMFFLSSLVRYHPDHMDRIADSTDAWLIESFAKAAPFLLLKSLVSGVLGYSLIIESA